MISETVLRQSEQAQRRQAVRLLLRVPVVRSEGREKEAFANVRRHEEELRRWFQHHMGYRLVVERDFARLHKVPSRPIDASHPIKRRSGKPFDRQRYTFSCLILATLDRGDRQIVLSSLAEAVHEEAQVEQMNVPDFERSHSRQAFVDAVRVLVEIGVLRFVDGDEKAFIAGDGDVLYDVDQRLAAQMLSAGWNPRAELDGDDGETQFYPETADGANARIRHRLMRALVEEPVLYTGQLSEAERTYLTFQRAALRRELAEMAGLMLEIRSEGLLVLDPENELSDRAFPATNDVAHAALLLASELGHLADEAGADHETVVSWQRVNDIVAGNVEEYGKYWSAVYAAAPDGPECLAREAVQLLADFRLVAVPDAGVRALPPICRYLPRADEPRQKPYE